MSDLRLGRDMIFARGRVHRYGPHPSQLAELHLPDGRGPHPVMVLIHGGSWRQGYGRVVMRSQAADLRRRGWAVWNIEYRRVGGGGGWPATFRDVAGAIDELAGLEAPLDLDRVDVLGHSAGGHLALWAASRDRLDAAEWARPAVRIGRSIAMAGVCDLGAAYELWNGGAVMALMGGSPQAYPERYAAGDPVRLLPVPMPVLLVHGLEDETVSISLSRRYAAAARAAGADVELVEIEGPAGRHRAPVYAEGPTWRAVIDWLAGVPRGGSTQADSERASSTSNRTP